MRAKFTLIKRTFKKPKPHTVYYYRLGGDPGRVLYSTGQTNRAAAEDWVRTLLDRPSGADITLDEYTTDFFVWEKCKWITRQHAQGHPFSIAVAKNRRSHLVQYILPAFGKFKLTEIKTGPIFNFLVKLQRTEKADDDALIKTPLSNQTKNHVKNTFSIVMDTAVFDELIEYNPVKNLKGFADTHAKRDIFNQDELRRLFPEDLNKVWEGLYWPTFFFTLLTAGMRLSEGRALTWSSIDWRIPAVSITRAVKADGTIGTTKSREQRAAFLPSRTIVMLKAWKSESRHTAENDLVFHGETGQRPMAKKTPWKYFKRALVHAKVKEEGRKLVIHSLRHNYDTAMREAISAAALQFMIGHKDARMTDRYDGAGPLEKLRRFLPERKKIEKAWK
jgi:integrase